MRKNIIQIAIISAITAMSVPTMAKTGFASTKNPDYGNDASYIKVDENFAQVGQHIEKLKAADQTITTDLDSVKTTADSALKVANGAVTTLEGHASKIEANATQIVTNKSEQDLVNQDHSDRIDEALEVGAEGQQLAVEALNDNHRQDMILDKHGSDIITNAQNIEIAQISADAANTKNAEQDKKLAKNKVQIDNLNTTTARHDREIQQTRSDMDAGFKAVNGRVDRLDAKVDQGFAALNHRIDDYSDEMKKGFAAQAALSGLFQPYTVGKFNLTGGVGTYESDVGIALGGGYRFNDNLAVKAGVATNASDFDAVTANASFNLEW